MTAPKPHYLLFCDGNVSANGESAGSQRGRWRFVLEDLVSGERIEATDQETACAPDRSALIAVLRGLEALEQPSRVTLVTTSRYVSRGLQYGLTEWRDNDYSWEHFGAVQPIRNADVWRRIDRALAYHQVQCRWMAQEGATETQDEPLASKKSNRTNAGESLVKQSQVACVAPTKESALQTNTVQTTHRRARTADTVRTKLSTSQYQRVYVDTPPANGVGTFDVPFAVSQDVTKHNDSNRGTVIATASFQGNSTPLLKKFLSIAFFPIQLLCRGPLLLCTRVWDGIVALDEWLESFLRCLFLLDPSKRATRR